MREKRGYTQNEIRQCDSIRYSQRAHNNYLTILKMHILKELTVAKRDWQAGRSQLATRLLEDVLKSYPDNAEALHFLGIIEWQSGKHEHAKKLIERAITKQPNNYHYYCNYGTLLMEQGEISEAINAYKIALSIKPNFWEALSNLGNAYRSLGKLEEAISAYKQAQLHNPAIAEIHCNLGTAYHSLGRLDDAVSSYTRALQINTGYADAYNNLGSVYRDMGQISDAISCFLKAIELDQKLVIAYTNLGSTLHSIMNYDQTQVVLEKALQIQPENGLARHLLSAIVGEKTESAPDDYVRELFDEYAEQFEHSLVKVLGYRVPGLLRQALATFINAGVTFHRAIDLGCGTGLCGVEFRGYSNHLSGIDLSHKMIKQARTKGIYDELSVSSIVEYLTETDNQYDLFLSADTFIYIGNLDPVFHVVFKRARKGAYFTFSTEQLLLGDYELQSTGRYAHSAAYIQSISDKYGFQVLVHQTVGLRKNKGNWIQGDIWVLQQDI